MNINPTKLASFQCPCKSIPELHNLAMMCEEYRYILDSREELRKMVNELLMKQQELECGVM